MSAWVLRRGLFGVVMAGRKRGTSHDTVKAEDEPMSTDLTWYVATRQAAERLGVSLNRIRLLLSRGRLKGRRLGDEWRIF